MRRAIFLLSAIVLLLCVAPPLQSQSYGAANGKGADEAARQEPEIATAPVQIDDKVLFRVRGTSSFPASERAAAIAGRIADVAADRSFRSDGLRVESGEEADVIMAGNKPLMMVTDSDARLEQMQRGYLAQMHRDRIGKALDEYRHSRSRDVLWRASLYAAGATLLLILIVALLFPFGRKMEKLLSERLRRRIQTAGLQSVEMMRAENILKVLHSTLRWVRIGAETLLIFLYVHLVLSLFPWTRGFGRRLLGVDSDALNHMWKALLGWIPDLIILIILYFLFRFLLRLLRHFFDALKAGRLTISGFDPEWARPTYKMARFAVLAFAVVVAYPYLPGSESAAFKGISVFIGVVFSLGSSAAVANVIAGYLIFYRRVFRVGDRVRVGDVVGDVLAIRLQVTHLLSLKNEEVTIPNAQILSGNVMNYSSLASRQGLILHTEVGIGYETPWRQVEAMLLQAAERASEHACGILKEPRPFVLIKRLGDFGIVYEINVYSDRPQENLWSYNELHRHILDVFNEYAVQIMTPAYIADTPQPKVVPRDQWYAPPASSPDRPGTAPVGEQGGSSNRQ